MGAARPKIPSVGSILSLLLTLVVTSILALPVEFLRFLIAIPCVITQVFRRGKRKTPITPETGYALVTGASGGIGEQIACQLAEQGYDLVLVARREDRLLGLKIQLEEKYKIKCEVIPMDLSKNNAAKDLHKRCTSLEKTCAVLINNAGSAHAESFSKVSEEKISYLIHLNVMSMVELTRAFLPDMLDRDAGRILVIGSIMGNFSNPHHAVYSGCKAFLNNWATSVSGELVESGVALTLVEPGGTDTGFFEEADATNVFYTKLPILMSAKTVAREALKAMWAAKRRSIIGIINWLSVLTMRSVTLECELAFGALCWSDV